MTAVFSALHVLFDLDGTLVDSRAAVMSCYRKVFRQELGRDFPPPEVDEHEVFAMRPRELFDTVSPGRGEALHAAYRAAYPSVAPLVAGFPGAREIVRGLARTGRQPALVTNKGLDRTLLDLEIAGIDRGAFSVIVAAEDTVERKPDPAPIRLALNRIGAAPQQAVYVGDGPQDILAARAAGMPVIAVSYGFYERSALERHAPDAIVDTPRALAMALGLELSEVAP